MVNTEAREHLNLPTIQAYWEIDNQFALGPLHEICEAFRQVQVGNGAVILAKCSLISGIDRGVESRNRMCNHITGS